MSGAGKGWSAGQEFVPRQTCASCGGRFYAPPALQRRGGGKYCSVPCRADAVRARPKVRVARICEQCGAAFEAYPSKVLAGRARFCGRACADAAQRLPKPPRLGPAAGSRNANWGGGPVQVTCIVCGTVVERHRSVPGKFCSQVCVGAWRSAHAEPYHSRAGSGGRREDLGGLYVRSRWEANWARYLNWQQAHGLIREWHYEPETFEFPVKRGNRFYTPDFRVTLPNGEVEYHEIKGWMDDNSRVKLARMARHHPHIKLVVIEKDRYNVVARQMRPLIPEWEWSAKKSN